MFKFANTAAFALAAIAAFGSAPASAQSVAVSFSGIDLSTAEGRQTLDRRIAHASAKVCNREGGNLTVAVRRSQRECREETARAATLKAERALAVRIAAR